MIGCAFCYYKNKSKKAKPSHLALQEGLIRRIDELAITKEGALHYLPFIETLCTVSSAPITVDVEDEIEREAALYHTFFSLSFFLSLLSLLSLLSPFPFFLSVVVFANTIFNSARQAIEAVEFSKDAILATKTKFSRPADFYAEMFKTDEQMSKVRHRLDSLAGQMKRADDVAKIRKLKKFGKAVQVEKEQEKAKRKAEDMGRHDLIKKGTPGKINKK